ncbi:hypothetical protein MAR_036509, partial [Mya arenaria]
VNVVCKALIYYCQNGWPDSKQKACEIRKNNWAFRWEISVDEGLLMKGNKFIIPISMRDDSLWVMGPTKGVYAKMQYKAHNKYSQVSARKCRGGESSSINIEKADDPYIALMNYRARPLQNGYSQSELLFGRNIQSNLP